MPPPKKSLVARRSGMEKARAARAVHTGTVSPSDEVRDDASGLDFRQPFCYHEACPCSLVLPCLVCRSTHSHIIALPRRAMPLHSLTSPCASRKAPVYPRTWPQLQHGISVLLRRAMSMHSLTLPCASTRAPVYPRTWPQQQNGISALLRRTMPVHVLPCHVTARHVRVLGS
jgi:hypothetical protein